MCGLFTSNGNFVLFPTLIKENKQLSWYSNSKPSGLLNHNQKYPKKIKSELCRRIEEND